MKYYWWYFVSLNKFDGELAVISKLRQSLEDGILQNNRLRAGLLEKVSIGLEPTHPYDATDTSRLEEVERLQARLQESERWNMSLQSRLDALQARARGVGGSAGNLTVLGNTKFTSPQSKDVETAGKVRKVCIPIVHSRSSGVFCFCFTSGADSQFYNRFGEKKKRSLRQRF